MAIFDGDTLQSIDDRFDYGEERISASGVMNGKVIMVAYTVRGDVIRIINARKAERHERIAYCEAVLDRPPDR
ncbi:MAG: BrnT family toxin [Rhodospirillaceae bacterium]